MISINFPRLFGLLFGLWALFAFGFLLEGDEYWYCGFFRAIYFSELSQ